MAVSWCDLWSLAADPDDGVRRREEYRAHVADARTAGVGEWRLVAEAVRGAVDDIRWCSESRVVAGRPSLALAVVVERDMAVVAMTIVMCAVFVVSLFPVLHALVVSLVVVAGGLLAVTVSREVKDRFRRARIRNRDA